MLYLIGVNHYIQYRNEYCQPKEYELLNHEISRLVRLHSIQWLLEEFNEDCLLLNNVKQSTLQLIAARHLIHHEFIDPDMKTRRQMGYYLEDHRINHHQIRIREAYWLKQIERHCQGSDNAVVLIGATHIETFSNLLNERSIAFEIVHKYWHQEDFET